MYNCILDEFNHMIWEQRIEELRFMLADESIDYNDTDRLGKTLLLQAIEYTEFYEDGGIFRPQQRWLDFIKWLLEQGSDANMPAEKPPVDFVLSLEAERKAEEGSVYDMSQILELLRSYGGKQAD